MVLENNSHAFFQPRGYGRVILASRRLDKLQTSSSELSNAVALEMDVADKISVQRACDTLEQQRELINICINNAGIAKLTPIFESDELDGFESVMKTNVMGVWYVSKMVANHTNKTMKSTGLLSILLVSMEQIVYVKISLATAPLKHL